MTGVGVQQGQFHGRSSGIDNLILLIGERQVVDQIEQFREAIWFYLPEGVGKGV